VGGAVGDNKVDMEVRDRRLVLQSVAVTAVVRGGGVVACCSTLPCVVACCSVVQCASSSWIRM